MTETEGVKEARRWRREVYRETKDLTSEQMREREDKLLQELHEAGIEFEAILDAPQPQSTSQT